MDENNNQNNSGSFDDSNIYTTYPANNTYEPFENTMPYEQNNNAQFNQNSNSGNADLFNLDNDTQYNQYNSFDNNTIYNQVNDDPSSYQSYDNSSVGYNQTNSFDNSTQNYQSNSYNNSMQYNQVSNYDNNTQYTQNSNYNMQYSEPTNYDNTQYSQNSGYDTNMQYNNDINAGYSQNNNYDSNMQYGQVSNNANSYQSYDNTNSAYGFDNNIAYNQNDNFGMNDGSDYTSDFKKAWMGKIYDKAHSKKFNWCSAFFSGTYFMYRKMYLSGLLLVILYSLICIIPSLMFFGNIITSVPLFVALSLLLPLLFMIISGFMFYPLYRSFVDKKFNSLKTTITDNSALINEAQTKGGTSALGVVIALIVSSVIISVGLFSTVNNAIEKLTHKNPNTEPDETNNEITEPATDMKSFNFLNEYSIEYDSLSWFFNPIDNSLTKGNYILTYSGQYIDDIKNNFNVDVTNNAGRSSLLDNLVSSLESQAAAINLSVEVATNTFVSDNNSYYAYLDIISDSAISRYYLLLLPEKDILFQFILSSNDTNIDYATNLEVINILTSISYVEDNEPDNENGNVIENQITNEVISNTITNEVPSGLIDNSNTISNEINSNTIVSNDTSVNTVNENTAIENNQVSLNSILN